MISVGVKSPFRSQGPTDEGKDGPGRPQGERTVGGVQEEPSLRPDGQVQPIGVPDQRCRRKKQKTFQHSVSTAALTSVIPPPVVLLWKHLRWQPTTELHRRL